MHEVLDSGAGIPDFANRAAHAAFLRRQLVARAAIEAWVARECPADIAPPPTVPALLDDLTALGHEAPEVAGEFNFPEKADPLGLAWALAGSHLGNRIMLAKLRETAPDAPHSFLDDAAMAAFWKELRPRLDAQVTTEQARLAIAAASAVFRQFLDAFGIAGKRLAA
ncbi:MAG: hypothetical protein WBA68_11830 [Alteraurantiacibacter sp.]